MIWFGWVLLYTNHCKLFNAKSSLYTYILFIGFGLVGFYGISTILGYLMPNTLYIYIYILNIYDLRINFFYFLRTFCPHPGSFCVVSSSLRFGQISPLTFFR